MPAFAQTMGIWFNPKFEDSRYSKNLYRKQQICTHFIERLPAHSYFLQNFHHSFTDWLPFYWKGYRQTTRYSYILPDISNLDKLWDNLSENISRNIQKAKNKYKLEVKRNIPVDLFMDIINKTFERQGKKAYQPDVLNALIATMRLRNQGDIWGAFDESGRLHAAVFVVWQENYAYYIAGGSDPGLRESGAHALVMWEAICDVSKNSVSFDFEGSMIQGVEHFFREFGATQQPFFVISKGTMNLFRRFVIRAGKLLLKRKK
jgi:lipid II:glycine glycyltransferase (peptidoglycan interpeptide bridge formation enzyme)